MLTLEELYAKVEELAAELRALKAENTWLKR